PAPRTEDGAARPANISGYLENLISYEQRTEARNLSWEMVEAEGVAGAALGSVRCLRVVRVRNYQERPISLSTIHVPEPHAARVDAARPASVPVIRQLEDAGIVAERTEQTMSAALAGSLAGDALGVAPDAPLIVMRRLMVDGDGAPVLHQESLYAPDRFEYRMTLTRTTVGPVARWTPIS
ncbi:MAG: UTRA domain-containing protein, partial [Pseudomonadota bacterium]